MNASAIVVLFRLYILDLSVRFVWIMERVVKKYFKLILIVTAGCCVATLLFYQLIYEPSSEKLRKLVSYVGDKKQRSDDKTILFWSGFFDYPEWGVDEIFETDFLKSTGCPWTNCIATMNRNYLTNVQDFDAIVFHATHPQWSSLDIPMIRSSYQVYIMATLE